MTRLFDVERYRNMIKNWWVSLVLGILFIGVGILVFMNPGESYLALSLLFGIMVVVSGILQILFGLNVPAHAGKGWMIASGIIELLLGILLFVLPGVLITILPFVLGFWLMFRGFTVIGFASDMMGNGVKGGGWVLAFAILVVITSFFVLINPFIGVGAIVIWLGLSLLFAGASLIAYAFHLKSLNKHLDI